MCGKGRSIESEDFGRRCVKCTCNWNEALNMGIEPFSLKPSYLGISSSIVAHP